jgi:hypothetical protein
LRCIVINKSRNKGSQATRINEPAQYSDFRNSQIA